MRVGVTHKQPQPAVIARAFGTAVGVSLRVGTNRHTVPGGLSAPPPTWRRPPARNRRPPTSTARTANQKEVTIPTDNEPTGSHRQSNPDQRLDGPPLGAKPQNRRLSPGWAQARRLLETASDEFVRLTVKASTTGLTALAVYWFERR